MKFLVVDHHPIVANANAALLRHLAPTANLLIANGLEEVGELRYHKIDGLLSCIRFPHEEPWDVLAYYESLFPDVPKVFFSSIDPNHPAVKTLRSKGHLFLPKTTTCPVFTKAVAVHFGLIDGYDKRPANKHRSLIQLAGQKALTIRQASIMEFLSLGKTAKEAARELGLSPDTVKRHLREVYARLGVSTRIEAVSAYLKAKAAAELLHTGEAG